MPDQSSGTILDRHRYYPMSHMTYRGYGARIDYYADDRIFNGRLAAITHIVIFHGASVNELETAFQESVDHYLAVNARRLMVRRDSQDP